MKRLTLSVVAALLAVGAATSVLKSHSLFPFGKSGMPPIGELQSADQIRSLPVQDFVDRTFEFPKEAKQ
ncbi:hypothetical protein TSA1_27765 [Bradyrhizobium nitroreducens]|uniref:Uncharacterized protein n=1 Tax=Bradyrhizobium nitroreducens TaxID=709803 RepID=A0A2M6UHS2_9BRAD|nr:hypothetical protein [Bradyrhizobium nitroreducens]PIT04143.1 hypothetical protein TSA1_27765 [Bradyrhizobium nitroreducens]